MDFFIGSHLETPPLAVQQAFCNVLDLLQPKSALDRFVLAIVGLATAAYALRQQTWDRPDLYRHVYFERPQQQCGSEGQRLQVSRDIAERSIKADKTIVIFWGSQSGTAEGLASRFAKEVQARFDVGAMTADLSEYDPKSIAALPSTKIAVFLLSTYGEGAPSDNASSFWEWIHQDQDCTLNNLRYAAFGLGNSNYKYYNNVVDVVTEALDTRGATRLLPVARSDEVDKATDNDFMSWRECFFQVLQHDLGFEQHATEYRSTIAVVEDTSLEAIDVSQGTPFHTVNNAKVMLSCSPIRPIYVEYARELFTSRDRNCVHMDLNLSDQPDLHYKTGDHMSVWPMNPVEEVNRLLRTLDLTARKDAPLSLTSLDSTRKIKIPSPTTTHALFQHYLEICASIAQETILGLAEFAPTKEAQLFVTNLGQSRATFAELTAARQLTIGRLLTLASPEEPWTNLPLSYLLEFVPTLQPRHYSISSSSILSPRKPSITALISSEPVSDHSDQRVYGVATNYLWALSESMSRVDIRPDGVVYDLNGPTNCLQGGKIFAHIRKSAFKLPALNSCPIIMVAAGTGLAPFRGFLAERAKLSSIGKPSGEMILFFGCRHPKEDFIYREELEQMQKSLGTKLRIITAFSRQQGQPKIYVQDRVREYGENVLRLMEANATFFICGRASMAKSVGLQVDAIMQAEKGWGEAEIRGWRVGLKRRGKWREDVWG